MEERRPAFLARPSRALTRLWDRIVHCRRGEHRDELVCELGVLQWRCVTCEHRTVLGFVSLHVSNKLHPHFPWERPDDA